MGVTAEDEMEVLKDLAVKDLTAMPEQLFSKPVTPCLTITKAKQICRNCFSCIYSTSDCTTPPTTPERVLPLLRLAISYYQHKPLN